MTNAKTILVTGATGKVGRRLIPLLWRRGATVRAAGRAPVAARRNLESVHFDWADGETYEVARRGVEAMFLVDGPIPQPAHADFTRALLAGAKEAGVKRVVLLSSFKAYSPVGPQPLTLTQVAEHISWAAGRPIKYVETDRTPIRDALLAAGAPPETAEHNSLLYLQAFSSNLFGVLNDDVRNVTGRQPVSFAEFAIGAAAAWRRQESW